MKHKTQEEMKHKTQEEMLEELLTIINGLKALEILNEEALEQVEKLESEEGNSKSLELPFYMSLN